jgi:hypothetical protein
VRRSVDVVVGAMRYEVVAREPARVKSELCELWRDNLTLACTAEAHFDRLYRDAPDPAPAVFVLCAAGGAGDAQIVGANGFSIRRFQLGAGVEDRAAVSGDLVVGRAHRSLLPALRLIRAVREHTAGEYAFCYGFPNAKAEGVMARAGFHVLGKTTRYARVLRHASYLPSVAARAGAPRQLTAIVRSAAPLRLLGRALSPVIDVARLAGGLPEIAEAQRRYSLAWTGAVDGRFDELWTRARREYDVIGARTAALLRWRYPRAEIAALERRSDRTLVAYAVIERDATTRAAHIRDVFGHKSALGPLFDLLLPAVWWAGAHSISIRVLGAPYLVEALVDRGFEPRGERRTVVVHVGRAHEAARARIESADTWHLLDLDEDT